MDADLLKVSSKSVPASVAGAIAGYIHEEGYVEVQAIGAGATNQAVKSIAIAREYLAESGVELICKPGFANVKIGEEERTAIKFVLEPR